MLVAFIWKHCCVRTNRTVNILHLHSDEEKLISQTLNVIPGFNETSTLHLAVGLRFLLPSTIFKALLLHSSLISSYPQYLSLSHSLPLLIPYLSPPSFSNLPRCSSLRTYAEGERCHKPWHSNHRSSWILIRHTGSMGEQVGRRAAIRLSACLSPIAARGW